MQASRFRIGEVFSYFPSVEIGNVFVDENIIQAAALDFVSRYSRGATLPQGLVLLQLRDQSVKLDIDVFRSLQIVVLFIFGKYSDPHREPTRFWTSAVLLL